MSTRSLTIVNNEFGEEIAVLYRQSDGYPEGHGLELAEAFGNFTIGRGVITQENYANGMGCFFAQLIAHFKTVVGGFYLEPAGTRNMDERYTYKLSLNKLENCLWLDVYKENFEGSHKNIFSGNLREFPEYLKLD